MARSSVTYSGTFGGVSAGSNGLDLKLTGSAIPSEKMITSITYTLRISAGAYSTSKDWRLIDFYIGSGSPYADGYEVSMSSSSYTFEGTMEFSASDISLFANGSFNLHVKANTSHSSSSYLWNVTITVNYKDAYAMTDVNAPFSVDAGQSMQITLSNAEISELKHTIICSIGSYSISKSLGVGETTCTVTVPKDWCNAVTKATSGTITITTKAYESDGTAVGTSTVTITMDVPADVKPTIGSVAVTRIANGVPTGWGNVYVQNVSGITLSVNNCTSAYGSEIVSYIFGGKMATTTQASSCTMQKITESGTITFTVKCVDARGRSSDEYTVEIDVIPYAPPYFSGAMAYRCDEEGTSNEQGTYIRAQASVVYSSCATADGTNLNGISLSCYFQKIGDSAWTNGVLGMAPSSFYTFGEGKIATGSTYQVKYVLADTFSTVEKIVTVSTSQYILFIKRGGTAIGIGKKCRTDIEYIIDISEDWTIWHGTVNITEAIKKIADASIPDIVYSTTQPELIKGRIWLKPK